MMQVLANKRKSILNKFFNKLFEQICEGYRRQYLLDLYCAGLIDVEEMLEKAG